MFISIILVTYNNDFHILNLLDDLKIILGDIEHEFIIFDNNSKIENQERLKNLNTVKKNLRIIYSKINIGFANACNQAATNALGDFLFFINPDVFLIDHSFRFNKEVFNPESKFFLIGSEESGMGWSNIKRIPAIQNLFKSILKVPINIQSLNYKNIYVDGSLWIIQKNVFTGKKGFPSLFLYGEDLLLFWEMRFESSEIKILGNGKTFGHARGYSSKLSPHKFTPHKFYAEILFLRRFNNNIPYMYSSIRFLSLIIIILRDVLKGRLSCGLALRTLKDILLIYNFSLKNGFEQVDKYHFQK